MNLLERIALFITVTKLRAAHRNLFNKNKRELNDFDGTPSSYFRPFPSAAV